MPCRVLWSKMIFITPFYLLWWFILEIIFIFRNIWPQFVVKLLTRWNVKVTFTPRWELVVHWRGQFFHMNKNHFLIQLSILSGGGDWLNSGAARCDWTPPEERRSFICMWVTLTGSARPHPGPQTMRLGTIDLNWTHSAPPTLTFAAAWGDAPCLSRSSATFWLS